MTTAAATTAAATNGAAASTGSDYDLLVGILVLLALAVGIAGIILPVLPGLGLICVALLAWALYDLSTAGWVALGVGVGLTALATVLKYYIPGRWLQASGVPTWEIVVAGLAGIVGFFVIPVLGLPIFFVAAVYVAESVRAGHWLRSLRSTWQAVLAVGLSQLIELAAALLAVSAWVLAVLLG